MKTNRPDKRDSTSSWPFIRWIKARQRWQVDARTASGGERRFFATKDEAEGFASLARIRRKNEGDSAFDGRELERYGWTVQRAIRFALDHLKKQSCSVPVEEAILLLVESKRNSKNTPYYCTLLRQRLEKMLPVFKGRKIASITHAEIEVFLNGLKVAPSTRNTVRRDLVTLWNYSIKMNWVESNEAETVDIAKEDEGEPEIFTPSQALSLLKASSDDDVLAFHAIGLFAGLRVSELKRLDWEEVDLMGGHITITARKAKTRSRRTVPIQNNLKDWLSPIMKESGPIIGANFQKRQLAAIRSAGFGKKGSETPIEKEAGVKLTPWPKNGLRHSFCSYRLAHSQDAAATALESGHGENVLFSNYRNLVSPHAAKTYFSLSPLTPTNLHEFKPSPPPKGKKKAA